MQVLLIGRRDFLKCPVFLPFARLRFSAVQGINGMTDVLLIDDETHYLASLAEGLRLYSKNLHVMTADNARKAIEILNTAVVDVVVTDLNMPCMSGYEFLNSLKRTHPHVPVIIMSACAQANAQGRLKNLKVAQYVEKPLDLETIARAILSVA